MPGSAVAGLASRLDAASAALSDHARRIRALEVALHSSPRPGGDGHCEEEAPSPATGGARAGPERGAAEHAVARSQQDEAQSALVAPAGSAALQRPHTPPSRRGERQPPVDHQPAELYGARLQSEEARQRGGDEAGRRAPVASTTASAAAASLAVSIVDQSAGGVAEAAGGHLPAMTETWRALDERVRAVAEEHSQLARLMEAQQARMGELANELDEVKGADVYVSPAVPCFA